MGAGRPRLFLREVCEEIGITLADLARRMDCDQSVLSHYATGSRKPGFEALVQIADALGVSIDRLAGRGGAEFDRGRAAGLAHAQSLLEGSR